ncbi:Uncharacterized protein TCM_008793 [Theobroma cacao]|uniref:Uncharacterized protein n=1 Tax=Theobroma cacao TaxID=3641 RepID=A0A061E4D6_THECC|nr:Uncharacterized protein TCM_008793 [Theobroma cacao]
MQVLKPFICVIEKIEQLFNNFLWGGSASSKKIHWAAWNKITLPSSEGGLDIRGLGDMFEAFSMKLWWRFQTCNSSWSKFMKAKYCYGRIPRYTQPKRHDSQTWKRMLACCPVIEQHMRCKIGKGELFFWHDCWMDDEPLINHFPAFSSSMTQVCYFFNNNEWDVDKLNTMLSEKMVAEILKIPFNTSSTDMAYWVPTSDGDFTTKSKHNCQIAAGGGLFRDHTSTMIFGFSENFGPYNSLQAELMALHREKKTRLQIISQIKGICTKTYM